MAIDRTKYKKADSNAMKAQKAEVAAVVYDNTGRSGWVKVEPGFNILRWFPGHEGTKGNLFLFEKVCSWLPQEIEEKDDKGEKTGKTIIENRPIFNSRTHGGTKKDLVEEYIAFVSRYYTESIQDKTELSKKLKPVLDWQRGLKPKVAWVGYAKKYLPDGTTKKGKIEITNSVKEGMNSLSVREEAGQPISVDIYSDIDNGMTVQVIYNKNEKDNKKKYATSLLFDRKLPMTEEDLEEFETWEPLRNLFWNSFKKSDFDKQLRGLEIFDTGHKYGAFQHDSFLDIVEEISNYYQDESTTDTPTDGSSSPSQQSKPASIVSSPPIKEEKDLNTMNRDELLKYIKDNDLDVSPRTAHTEERIRSDIREALEEKKSQRTPPVTESIPAPEGKKENNLPFSPGEQVGENKKEATSSTGKSRLEELRNRYK